MAYYQQPDQSEGFPNAFQRQFRRSLGVPGDPDANPVGGGGPQPIPEGGPGWRQQQEGFPGGGGGPMPIPEGGPDWKNLGTGGFHPGGTPLGNEPPAGGGGGPQPIPYPDEGPAGGGGGPMPIPDPWLRPGANPEDFGVTMEFGGPGAVNPPGMNPAQLRQHYAQPSPQQPQGPGRMMGGGTPQAFGGNRPQRQGNELPRRQMQPAQNQGWDPQTGWGQGRKQEGWGHQTGWGQGQNAPAGTGGFNFQQAMPKPQGNWNWGDNSNIFRRKF